MIFSVFLIFNFAFYIPVYGQSSILDLNDSIQDKKQAQRELQQKIAEYNRKIRETQRKAASLKNQINILEANIDKTELEIRTKALEAEQLKLEADLIAREIAEEQKRYDGTLEDIAKGLREVKRYDDRKYLEIVFAKPSFSSVLDQLYYSERLVTHLKDKLNTIQEIRQILAVNKENLQDKYEETNVKKDNLAILQNTFEQERRAKGGLFGKTRATEAEFQALLVELRAAASAIDSDIVTLEKRIRERLDLADKLAGDTGVLSWPISPVGGLSAQFHDPDYPFRYLFEHAGIDIRTPQGTPVRAAASGYVAAAYNGGMGIRPSYVMLVHGNQLATVYMHLSSIAVRPDIFVARGDVIGRSGGTPRTSGAGRWSTGPHLHFETRVGGVPVNPLGYLP